MAAIAQRVPHLIARRQTGVADDDVARLAGLKRHILIGEAALYRRTACLSGILIEGERHIVVACRLRRVLHRDGSLEPAAIRLHLLIVDAAHARGNHLHLVVLGAYVLPRQTTRHLFQDSPHRSVFGHEHLYQVVVRLVAQFKVHRLVFSSHDVQGLLDGAGAVDIEIGRSLILVLALVVEDYLEESGSRKAGSPCSGNADALRCVVGSEHRLSIPYRHPNEHPVATVVAQPGVAVR